MQGGSWKKDLDEVLRPILESGYDLEDPEPEYVREFTEDTLAAMVGFDEGYDLSIVETVKERDFLPKKSQGKGKPKGGDKKSKAQKKK
ncbi:hypothetical protein [Thermofilum sp.]|uniref:hypothetical protein n=1 Tax=Thermofilum sp. TaxID=1961369 RepID=UPI00258DA275|nr:hypothetical protein [Thermofilum sp.]